MRKARLLSFVMALVMMVSLTYMPVSAADEITYKDGTYTKTVKVEPDEWEDFSAYDLSVDTVIENGKISSVALSADNTFGGGEEYEDNESLSNRALNGRGSKVGVAAQIVANNGVENVDAVASATCSSTAILTAVSAALEDAKEESAGSEEEQKESGYVLMNIPYDEFYAAEGVSSVDAVTTATVKTYNMGKAAGSYHAGYEAADPIENAAILGVTYPVYVEDMSVLEGLTQVKAEDTATITVASGKSALTTKEVSGVDLLFASGDYAYYVMDTEPTHYKTLSVVDGTFSFSAVNAEAAASTATAELKYACNYTDIELIVEADEIVNASKASAIILTADGVKYALRHVENEWDRTDLGWNWEDLDGNGLSGKTITNVT